MTMNEEKIADNILKLAEALSELTLIVHGLTDRVFRIEEKIGHEPQTKWKGG